MKMKIPTLPTFSFSLNGEGWAVTTNLGDTPGDAGAILWDGATEPFDALLKNGHCTWTRSGPWHFGLGATQTLVIAKNKKAFPVPLKLTGTPTPAILRTIGQALEAALDGKTFFISYPVEDGCLSHTRNTKADFICWWLPCSGMGEDARTLRMSQLLKIVRHAHNITNAMRANIGGLHLDSQGRLSFTEDPEIFDGSKHHVQASHSLKCLVTADSLMAPGMLLSQSFTVDDKAQPKIISRPLITTGFNPETFSGHEQIKAKDVLQKVNGLIWETD